MARRFREGGRYALQAKSIDFQRESGIDIGQLEQQKDSRAGRAGRYGSVGIQRPYKKPLANKPSRYNIAGMPLPRPLPMTGLPGDGERDRLFGLMETDRIGTIPAPQNEYPAGGNVGIGTPGSVYKPERLGGGRVSIPMPTGKPQRLRDRRRVEIGGRLF